MALVQLEESVVDGAAVGQWCILTGLSVLIGNYKVVNAKRADYTSLRGGKQPEPILYL